MRPYPTCSDRIFDCCNVSLRLLTVISAFVLLLLMTTSIMKAQCYDYCNQGYFNWDVSTAPNICFTVAQGQSQTVCLEINLSWPGVPGCNPNETVTLGIFNGAGQRVDTACVSPFNYTFTANAPPNPKNCPNGQDVHCCAAFCPEDLYIKILDSNGNDYSQCYTGTVKCCINCYQKYQGGPCTQ